MDNKVEALKDTLQYMEKVKAAAQTIIDYIDNGQSEKVFGILAQMSEGIEWLLSVFELTSDIQVQKIDTKNMHHIISNMVQGLENKDYILLRDTVEYEFIEQLQDWKSNVNIILECYSS